MKITTSRFGELDIEESSIIYFTQGIPGFEELSKYVLIYPEDSQPFAYLQSLEWGELAFIVTDPFLFNPQYQFEVTDHQKEELQIKSNEDISVWVIVTVTNRLQEATMNLMAPIIVNAKSKKAKQFVLHNTSYQTKHPLLPTTAIDTRGDSDARSHP
ncbi:flagellar assembly protein FliW [Paenibacillus sp. J2TS4]|uniref:flagellar assembly protein FliW n=1 Tax=Paenibacillus sp. J2TS4 TaxID=2807194 RepID=UPI001B2AA4AA|nr:flagellar assembly protein FliW [Paenibacillus sp. J2TS4]GIP35599.1 flagellar assembly factor FliW [Paenibacillus sp. J2TS4]